MLLLWAEAVLVGWVLAEVGLTALARPALVWPALALGLLDVRPDLD